MAENFVLGMDAKLYYGDDLLSALVTPATNSWNELDNCMDVNLSLTAGEAEITTRANSGWKATAATLKEGSIDFEMIWKPADADPGFTAIQEAWIGGTELSLMCLDGDEGTSDNQGLASNFVVTNFTRTEPLAEAIKVAVTIKPSSFTEWYKVA